MRKVEDKSKEEIVKIGRKIGEAFVEAEKKNIPCVPDTDTLLKVRKYICCGMKLCGEKKITAHPAQPPALLVVWTAPSRGILRFRLKAA